MFQSAVTKFACGLLCLAVASISLAQQPAVVHILLLNGNDGYPLPPDRHYALVIFPWCATNRVCFFPDKRIGWPVDASGRIDVPIIDKLEKVEINRPNSLLMYCQSDLNSVGVIDPTFRVDEILRSGVVAPNNCNTHLRLEPHPGELVFFLRPLSWWEKLTKPPQM